MDINELIELLIQNGYSENTAIEMTATLLEHEFLQLLRMRRVSYSNSAYDRIVDLLMKAGLQPEEARELLGELYYEDRDEKELAKELRKTYLENMS